MWQDRCMRKITIKDFRKYTEIIERLDEDLNREAFVEEFMVEAQLDKETAREIFSFIRDDVPVLEEDPNKYELIIRRGLGNNELKKLRIKSNLTQREMADRIDVNSVSISQWESCRAYPTEIQRKKIASLFRCREEFLFPEWLKFIADELKTAETEKVVEIGKMSLDSPELLMLEADDGNSIEKIGDKIKGKQLFEKVKEILSPRHLNLIKFRFGFEDGVIHTLEEAGQKFGVTRERIRQIEAKALDIIRSEVVEV